MSTILKAVNDVKASKEDIVTLECYNADPNHNPDAHLHLLVIISPDAASKLNVMMDGERPIHFTNVQVKELPDNQNQINFALDSTKVDDNGLQLWASEVATHCDYWGSFVPLQLLAIAEELGLDLAQMEFRLSELAEATYVGYFSKDYYILLGLDKVLSGDENGQDLDEYFYATHKPFLDSIHEATLVDNYSCVLELPINGNSICVEVNSPEHYNTPAITDTHAYASLMMDVTSHKVRDWQDTDGVDVEGIVTGFVKDYRSMLTLIGTLYHHYCEEHSITYNPLRYIYIPKGEVPNHRLIAANENIAIQLHLTMGNAKEAQPKYLN